MGRRDFDLPADLTWLDTAHQGPLPKRAAAALHTALKWKSNPSHLSEEKFFETPERARSVLASFLRVRAAEVIVGNSASFGLDLLARGLGLRDGDEILLVRDDFPATVVPWLPLRDRGVRIRFLQHRENLDLPRIKAALRPETRLFCATWIDSFSGAVLDVQGVGRLCRESDILFVLNGTQGVGVCPLDLSRLAVDALTCTGYKWLCGPYGTGFCWVRTGLLSELRTGTRYWLPAVRAHGLKHLDAVVDADWPRDARGHDVFCTASFFNLLPWIGSLTYLAGLGIERIWAHNQAMVAALGGVLADRGYRVSRRKRASPFVVVEPEGADATRLAERLKAAGIHVALRAGRVRISPHVHNDITDVERVRRALS